MERKHQGKRSERRLQEKRRERKDQLHLRKHYLIGNDVMIEVYLKKQSHCALPASSAYP